MSSLGPKDPPDETLMLRYQQGDRSALRIVIAGEQGALRTQSREVIRQLPLEKSDGVRAVHADHSQIIQPDKERFSGH